MSQSPISGGDVPPDLVRLGRDALDRRAWTDAFELLSQADAKQPLSGADLEVLAEAAFFSARGDARVEIKERAFKAYLEEGDPVRAAYQALDVAGEHMLRGRVSIASAWARRAEPLLDGQPETYAHGYLGFVQADMAKARAICLRPSSMPRRRSRSGSDLAIRICGRRP